MNFKNEVTRITYKTQPNKSKQCGQAVLAMLLNKSINEICHLMKKNRGTNNRDIKNILDIYLVNWEYKRCKFEKNIPNYSIIKIGFKGLKNTHWILKVDDLYYDPEIGIIKKYNKDLLVKFMSYIKVIE